MSTPHAVPAAQAALSRQDPWPGLASFREQDAMFFRGRDEEAEELLACVRRSGLTVLFGRSGLGKTSLLHAGLFPRLRDHDFLPLYLRIDHDASAKSGACQILDALSGASAGGALEAPSPLPGDTLWAYFHRKDGEGNKCEMWGPRNRLVTPVLVLDQFEELFTRNTLPETVARGDAFFQQLADLVENQTPASLRAAFAARTASASDFDFDVASVRVVLSLREDFLAHLERKRSIMPRLMQERYEIRAMHGGRALQVVCEAGSEVVQEREAIEIVRKLAGTGTPAEPPAASVPATQPATAGLDALVIEPALLSLLCRELNRRRTALGQAQITSSLIAASTSDILSSYYDDCFRSTQRPGKAREFVEENLLTVSGYRDSVAVENALLEISQSDMDALVDTRLLRIDDRGGQRRLEFTHDVLTGIASARRDERRRHEHAERTREDELRKAKAAQEEAERQLQRAREEAERRQERARAKTRARVLIGALSLALVAGTLGTLAEVQRRKATRAMQEASELQTIAELRGEEARKAASEARAAEADQRALKERIERETIAGWAASSFFEQMLRAQAMATSDGYNRRLNDEPTVASPFVIAQHATERGVALGEFMRVLARPPAKAIDYQQSLKGALSDCIFDSYGRFIVVMSDGKAYLHQPALASPIRPLESEEAGLVRTAAFLEAGSDQPELLVVGSKALIVTSLDGKVLWREPLPKASDDNDAAEKQAPEDPTLLAAVAGQHADGFVHVFLPERGLLTLRRDETSPARSWRSVFTPSKQAFDVTGLTVYTLAISLQGDATVWCTVRGERDNRGERLSVSVDFRSIDGAPLEEADGREGEVLALSSLEGRIATLPSDGSGRHYEREVAASLEATSLPALHDDHRAVLLPGVMRELVFENAQEQTNTTQPETARGKPQTSHIRLTLLRPVSPTWQSTSRRVLSSTWSGWLFDPTTDRVVALPDVAAIAKGTHSPLSYDLSPLAPRVPSRMPASDAVLAVARILNAETDLRFDSLTISPDGETIAALEDDTGHLVLYRTRMVLASDESGVFSPSKLSSLEHRSWRGSLVWSNSGTRLAATTFDGIVIYDLATGSTHASISSHVLPNASPILFSTDDSALLCNDDAGVVAVQGVFGPDADRVITRLAPFVRSEHPIRRTRSGSMLLDDLRMSIEHPIAFQPSAPELGLVINERFTTRPSLEAREPQPDRKPAERMQPHEPTDDLYQALNPWWSEVLSLDWPSAASEASLEDDIRVLGQALPPRITQLLPDAYAAQREARSINAVHSIEIDLVVEADALLAARDGTLRDSELEEAALFTDSSALSLLCIARSASTGVDFSMSDEVVSQVRYALDAKRLANEDSPLAAARSFAALGETIARNTTLGEEARLRGAALAAKASELLGEPRAKQARDRALAFARLAKSLSSELKLSVFIDNDLKVDATDIRHPEEQLSTLIKGFGDGTAEELAKLSWLEVEAGIADISSAIEAMPPADRTSVVAMALTLRGRLYLETHDRRHLAWPDLRDGLALDVAARGHSRVLDALRAHIPTLQTQDARAALVAEYEAWLKATPELVSHGNLNSETGRGLALVLAAARLPAATIADRLVQHATIVLDSADEPGDTELAREESTARVLRLAKELPQQGGVAPATFALFNLLLKGDNPLTPAQRSEALAYRGVLHDEFARPLAAEADLREALALNAANEWARVELASRLVLSGRVEEGKELAAQARAGTDEVEHPFADQQLAIATIVSDAGEEAIASALQLVASHTSDAWPAIAAKLAARHQLLIGDEQAALRLLSTLKPQDADFMLSARALAASGDRVAADVAFEEAQRSAMRSGSYAIAALANAHLATRARDVSPDDMFTDACNLAERACVLGGSTSLHLLLAELLITRAGVPESDEAGSALRLLSMMHVAEATRIRGFVTNLEQTPWAIARHEQLQAIANDRIFELMLDAASSAPQKGERAARLAAVYALLANELAPLPADVHEAAWRRELRDGIFGRSDASLADSAKEHCTARAIELLRDALAAGLTPQEVATRAELASLVPILVEATRP